MSTNATVKDFSLKSCAKVRNKIYLNMCSHKYRTLNQILELSLHSMPIAISFANDL